MEYDAYQKVNEGDGLVNAGRSNHTSEGGKGIKS
jgi:hypothetical protein